MLKCFLIIVPRWISVVQQHVIGNQTVGGSLERESSYFIRKHFKYLIIFHVELWYLEAKQYLPLKQSSIVCVKAFGILKLRAARGRP